jgi:hypothetical protein
MHRPLVSVVIPCFRQGHFLAGAVDSALNQSHPAVEVIVVNDGSDDQTDEVARRYGERINYIFQENRGLARARNTGAAAATGKYLLFLDADDLLHPSAVEWLVEAAGGRDDVLCATGHRAFTGDPGASTGRDVLPPRVASPSGQLLSTCFGPPHAFLSSRAKVAALGGFDPAPAGCEDYDLWVRLVLAGCEVVPVFRVAAYYRRHPASMSTCPQLMGTGCARVLRRVLDVVRKSPEAIRALGRDPRELRKDVRRRIGRELFDAGYASRQMGRYWPALYFYLASLRWGRFTAFTGICKLLPHWLVLQLRRAS